MIWLSFSSDIGYALIVVLMEDGLDPYLSITVP